MTEKVNPVTISLDNMPETWKQYKRLAFHVARPYMWMYPSQTEDIEQECFITVYEAVSKYDAAQRALYSSSMSDLVKGTDDLTKT